MAAVVGEGGEDRFSLIAPGGTRRPSSERVIARKRAGSGSSIVDGGGGGNAADDGGGVGGGGGGEENHNDSDDDDDGGGGGGGGSDDDDDHPGMVHDRVPPGKSSVMRSAVNQANTIIGAGMLSFPKALAGCGGGLGSVLLLGFACMSVIDQHLLACVARKFGRPSSFKSVCDGSGLEKHAYIVDGANVLVSVGACIAYLMVAGDTLARIVEESVPGGAGAWGSRTTWIILAALFVAPLCCLKRLDALAATSSIAILFVFYIAGLVVVTSLGAGREEACLGNGDNDERDDDDDDNGSGGAHIHVDDDDDDAYVCGGERSFAVLAPSTIASLPVFTFGYNCQQNVFSTQHNELRDATPARANSVAVYAVGGATAVYLLVSVCGYATFGPSVASDVLDSFATATPAVTAARLGISMVVLFSYPVVLHATRPSAFNLTDSATARLRAFLDQPARKRMFGRWNRRLLSGGLADDEDDEDEDDDDEADQGSSYDSVHLVPSDRHSSSSSSSSSSSTSPLHPPPLPNEEDNEQRAGVASPEADTAAIATTTASSSSSCSSAASTADLSADDPSTTTTTTEANESRLHIVLSMVFCTMVVALSFENLDVVLGLAGATGATMICYIIPGYCYATNFNYPHPMRTIALAQLAFGVVLGPASVVIILMQASGAL